VWQHPFWRGEAVDDLDEYCAFVRDETDLRLGIEADFLPGREDRMANLLDAREWDYVIGSVHFLREMAVDADDEWDVWRGARSADDVWRRYFEAVGEAARSRLFDILGHPDLVKIWGAERPRPEGDLRRFYEMAMEWIAESKIAIEVSTAGLRKPVGEIYPDRVLLEWCLEAGCPVALSSDAHVPDQLGYRYEDALEFLAGLGVGELCVFERRRRRLEPLGPP
jgi:histidinol-phosphatase (PHP family)